MTDHLTALCQEAVAHYTAIAADLERVLPQGSGAPARSAGDEDALQALPAALSNLHSLLIHVAARLDRLHERLADAKEAHLAQLAAVRFIPLGGCLCLCMLGACHAQADATSLFGADTRLLV